MILPGNCHQTIVDALEGLTFAPQTLASTVVHNLSEAGFRIVDLQELDGIIRELLRLVEKHDKLRQDDMNEAAIKAKALLEILRD